MRFLSSCFSDKSSRDGSEEATPPARTVYTDYEYSEKSAVYPPPLSPVSGRFQQDDLDDRSASYEGNRKATSSTITWPNGVEVTVNMPPDFDGHCSIKVRDHHDERDSDSVYDDYPGRSGRSQDNRMLQNDHGDYLHRGDRSDVRYEPNYVLEFIAKWDQIPESNDTARKDLIEHYLRLTFGEDQTADGLLEIYEAGREATREEAFKVVKAFRDMEKNAGDTQHWSHYIQTLN
jgi:hypothetical protein